MQLLRELFARGQAAVEVEKLQQIHNGVAPVELLGIFGGEMDFSGIWPIFALHLKEV